MGSLRRDSNHAGRREDACITYISPVACISLRSPGPVSGGMGRIIRQASFKMISRGTAAISLPHLEHTASKIERREAALTNTTLDS